jgi:hypothetical protein
MGKLTGLDSLERSLKKAGAGLAGIPGERAMNKALAVLDPLLQEHLSKKLKSRSGTLRKSIRRQVKRSGAKGMPEGRIGPSAVYAAIHEKGGTVRARSGRNLAIPLPPAQTALGVPRGTPASYPDLFAITGKSGKKVLVQDSGGRLKAFFVLQRSVKLKKRPFLKPAAKAGAARVAEIVGDAYVVGLRTSRRKGG